MLMTLMRVERFGGGQLTIGDEKLFLCPRLCCAVWQYRGAYRQQRIRKVTRLGACRYVPRLCRESTIVHDERVHLSMTKSTLLLLFSPLSSPRLAPFPPLSPLPPPLPPPKRPRKCPTCVVHHEASRSEDFPIKPLLFYAARPPLSQNPFAGSPSRCEGFWYMYTSKG
jgi:hypothetical protein